MKAVITGGTGLVARYVAEKLDSQGFEVILVVSDGRDSFAEELYSGNKNCRIVSRTDFFSEECLNNIIPGAYVVHTAFTRKNEGHEVAKSLDYAYTLFDACKKHGAKGVVNCSSRSIYEEPKEGEFNTEDSPINPTALISTAKYGEELMLRAFFDETKIQFTNLRIASINELKTDNNMVRPLNIFVDCVMNGNNIRVFNGTQTMSFVDPRDVANAVCLILSSDKAWKPVYNVGAGSLCTEKLLDMAKKVVEIGVELGYPEAAIEIVEKDITQTAGMSIDLIKQDFGYEPAISLEIMIRSLFSMKEEEKKQENV